MKKRVYFITAAASYLILLTATIPAKPVVELLNNSTPVMMQGISGTMWNGKAVLTTINNTTQLKDTEWSFTVWKLLIGQIAIDVNSRYLDNNIDAELGASFTGTYFVNNLIAQLPAKDVAQLANIPLAQLTGLISFNIEYAQWKRGELPLASGEISWNDATVTMTDTASLGNVSITLGESEQQLLNADINNQGGDIKITGYAQLVPEANYEVNIKLSPTATASNNIKQGLGLFSKKLPNGEYHFKNSGSLNEIGLM
jgi:hypothetical protein